MTDGMGSSVESGEGVDIAWIRQKYEAERQRRVGNGKSRGATRLARGDMAKFAADPHKSAVPGRQPIAEDVEAVIVGGGFGGLLAAVRLQEAGVTSLRVIDVAGDFGGAWYWNRFPGLRCDTEAYVYMPLLEETGYIPTQRYAPGSEILQHAHRIGRHYKLYEGALFHTGVVSARWQEPDQRWMVETNAGDKLRCRYLIVTHGPLDVPKIPDVPGSADFSGHMFHTSRWDYDYTGGSPTSELDKLADKNVVLVGTAATAVQVAPHLARAAKRLFVLQRTPGHVSARNNRPTDPEWAASLKPGWQAERERNYHFVTGGAPLDDVVNDSFTQLCVSLSSAVKKHEGASAEELALVVELADLAVMSSIRARVSEIVKDPATAEKLKPWYRLWCKRPLFSDEYLEIFNRPNVELIDAPAGGLEGLTSNGIIANGREYPADCVVFSTGFDFGSDPKHMGFEIFGRGGISLTEHWSDGPRTLHGFYSSGFPNLFHMGMVQNSTSVSIVYMLGDQAKHIALLVRHMKESGYSTLEPSYEAESAWRDTMAQKAQLGEEFAKTCTPGLYNANGDISDPFGVPLTNYGGGSAEYQHLIEKWRSGPFEGLVFSQD